MLRDLTGRLSFKEVRASARRGWADARCAELVEPEVKTTKALRPDRDWVYQLVGYDILDEDDALAITDVGYLPGCIPALVSWPFDELVEMLAGQSVNREELRREFYVAVAEGMAAQDGAGEPPERCHTPSVP